MTVWNQIPRLVIALVGAAIFTRELIHRLQAAVAARSHRALIATMLLSGLTLLGLCWVVACRVLGTSDSLIWPGLFLASASSLVYFAVVIFYRKILAHSESAHRMLRKTSTLMAFALGVTGIFTGIALAKPLLALPMTAVAVGSLGLLIVQAVREALNEERRGRG